MSEMLYPAPHEPMSMRLHFHDGSDAFFWEPFYQRACRRVNIPRDDTLSVRAISVRLASGALVIVKPRRKG